MNAAFNLMLSCHVSPVLLLMANKPKHGGQTEGWRHKLCLAVTGVPGAPNPGAWCPAQPKPGLSTLCIRSLTCAALYAERRLLDLDRTDVCTAKPLNSTN